MTAKQGIGRNVLYPVFTLGGHMQLSRYEQEVVINFNVAEQMASVYCADPKIYPADGQAGSRISGDLQGNGGYGSQ